jgi:hypothetical protein
MFGNYKYNLVCNVPVFVFFFWNYNSKWYAGIANLFVVSNFWHKTNSENIKMIWSNTKSGKYVGKL